MNRRNFILGLGTAATLSGAASVTGASLQDAVAPAADFRVIASEELNVQDNDYLEEGNDANYTAVDPQDGFEHNDTSASYGTNLSVNDNSDNDLELALAMGNDPSNPQNNFTDDPAYFNDTAGSTSLNSTNSTTTVSPATGAEAPLQIENETNEAQSVGIQYNNNGGELGGAVDHDSNNGAVAQSEVETLFQFFIDDDTDLTQISPDGTGNDEPYAYVNVPAAETKLVHLGIYLTDSIQSSIQEAAEATGTGGFSDGAEDDVNLLNTAAFGVESA